MATSNPPLNAAPSTQISSYGRLSKFFFDSLPAYFFKNDTYPRGVANSITITKSFPAFPTFRTPNTPPQGSLELTLIKTSWFQLGFSYDFSAGTGVLLSRQASENSVPVTEDGFNIMFLDFTGLPDLVTIRIAVNSFANEFVTGPTNTIALFYQDSNYAWQLIPASGGTNPTSLSGTLSTGYHYFGAHAYYQGRVYTNVRVNGLIIDPAINQNLSTVEMTYTYETETLLQRFLGIFQLHMEQYTEDADGLLNLPFASTTPYKFLNYVASLYGNPPANGYGDDEYSKVLEHIQILNKYKGTMEGLQAFFAIMGITATIILDTPIQYTHDNSFEHDDPNVVHDSTSFLCTKYILSTEDPAGVITDLTTTLGATDTYRLIQSILKYYIPVNMVMTDFEVDGVSTDIRLSTNLILFDWGGSLGTGFVIGAGTNIVGAGTTQIGIP